MIKRFMLYGALGFIMEILWTGLGGLLQGNWLLPAFTSLWMFPIYGVGVFFEAIHDRIRLLPWVLRGLIWMLLIFTVEYSSGVLFMTFLGRCPWNYGVGPLSIRGLIRLDYGPVWFTVGLIFERVHDRLNRLGI